MPSITAPEVPLRAEARGISAVPPAMQRFLSLDDFERAARRYLPHLLHGFVAGGTESDSALTGNRAALDRLALVPSVLNDVSRRSAACRLLGIDHSAPFGIAPMGMGGLVGYRADVALARAASAAGVPMIVSGSSLVRMEDIRTQGGADWFQAYLPGDDDRIDALVDRVAAAGFRHLMLTVDIPVPANRENNERAGYTTPLRPSLKLAWDGLTHPRWLAGTWCRTFWRHGAPHFENLDAMRGAPAMSRNLVRAVGPRDQLSWRHVDRIRRRWSGAFVLKGLLAPADVLRAREAGVDAVVVSNHGGRQLDHSIAPIEALPAIRAAVPDLPLIMDGSIRRGTDVLKALALGADFVLVGRPLLFAAAVAGEEGAARAIRLLHEEIDRDMALMGLNSPQELRPDHVHRRGKAMI